MFALHHPAPLLLRRILRLFPPRCLIGPPRSPLAGLEFAWLIGNCDAHAKNCSVLEPGTPNAKLAPVYDMLSTECYPDLDQRLAMKIWREDSLTRINRNAVETLGRRTGFEPGEATERLHDLSERTRSAIKDARNDGLGYGPIKTEQ